MIVSFLLCSSKHELARYVWKLFRRVPLQLDCVRSPTIIWKIQTNIPIGSMYGIFTYIWRKIMVDVGTVNKPYMDPVG